MRANMLGSIIPKSNGSREEGGFGSTMSTPQLRRLRRSTSFFSQPIELNVSLFCKAFEPTLLRWPRAFDCIVWYEVPRSVGDKDAESAEISPGGEIFGSGALWYPPILLRLR